MTDAAGYGNGIGRQHESDRKYIKRNKKKRERQKENGGNGELE